jgi:hypothetical protein
MSRILLTFPQAPIFIRNRISDYRRKGSWLCLIVFIAFAFRTLSAATRTEDLIQTFFENESHGGNVVIGGAEIGPVGIVLGADSRLRFENPFARNTRAGSILLRFTPPRHDRSFSLLNIGPNDCLCAIKLQTGGAEIEFSDRWLRIQGYDSTLTYINTIFAEKRYPPKEHAGELELAVHYDHGFMAIEVNGSPMLEADNIPYDFGRIEIATYRHLFTFHELSATIVRHQRMVIDTAKGAVDLRAQYQPQALTSASNGDHHFVAYSKGPSREHALFFSDIQPLEFWNALSAIGARPGDNLPAKAWSQRNDPQAKAPRIRTRGSLLEATIIYDSTEYPLGAIVADDQNQPYAFRFSGNKANWDRWHSGCLACFQSCPSGVASNAAYTMHDLALGKTGFTDADSVPFGPNHELTIRFKVKETEQ